MDKRIDEIKDLHKLHCVTKDFNHIIEYQPGSWKMFEPSKFVYAYFAFNSFYNYNWKGVLVSKELVTFSNETDGQKYKAMLEFIFQQLGNDDAKILDKKMSTEYVNFILQPKKNKIPSVKKQLYKPLMTLNLMYTLSNPILISSRKNLKNF